MIAIIATGGKQYVVKEGQELNVEKLETAVGGSLAFSALLVADEEGADVKVGTPNVSGATVTATVLEQGRGEKISIIKFKPKVRYRRKRGHRQPFTKIKIEKIA